MRPWAEVGSVECQKWILSVADQMTAGGRTEMTGPLVGANELTRRRRRHQVL